MNPNPSPNPNPNPNPNCRIGEAVTQTSQTTTAETKTKKGVEREVSLSSNVQRNPHTKIETRFQEKEEEAPVTGRRRRSRKFR